MSSTTKTAALVLSGGGALGAAHFGAVAALMKKGYRFDHFTGVSAGAIAAALLAFGKTPEEGFEIFASKKIRHILDLSSMRHGLLSGKRLLAIFESVFGSTRIEELSHPLVLGATDFSTGDRVMLRSGSISHALRASTSVPLLFEPFFHPEMQSWLVDGGIIQNYPVDVPIEEYKGDRIIGVDVASAFDRTAKFDTTTPRRKIHRIVSRTLRIIFTHQQGALPSDPRVVRVLPDTSEFNAADLSKLKELYQKGEEAVGDI